MNSQWFVASLCLGAICGGCASSKEMAHARLPVFSEQEVRSRVWSEQQGQVFQLLEWSEISFQFHGEFVIAKFGNTNTGFVTCLDIYRVNHLGKGPAGVIPTFASALLATATPAPEIVADRRALELVTHDNGREMVKSVQTDETRDEALFTISRETVPGATKERMGLRYRLFYNGHRGIHQNPSVEMWNIPAASNTK